MATGGVRATAERRVNVLAPKTTPAITSLGWCTPRYAREAAVASTRRMPAGVDQARRSGPSAIAAAMTTAVAKAVSPLG